MAFYSGLSKISILAEPSFPQLASLTCTSASNFVLFPKRSLYSTAITGIGRENWYLCLLPVGLERILFLFNSVGLNFISGFSLSGSTGYESIFILKYGETNCYAYKTKNETKKISLLPGRGGILRSTGGATASEMLTITTVTKLVVASRATEHMKESSASQTTGLSGAVFPSFTSVSSFWDLGYEKYSEKCSQWMYSVV